MVEFTKVEHICAEKRAIYSTPNTRGGRSWITEPRRCNPFFLRSPLLTCFECHILNLNVLSNYALSRRDRVDRNQYRYETTFWNVSRFVFELLSLGISVGWRYQIGLPSKDFCLPMSDLGLTVSAAGSGAEFTCLLLTLLHRWLSLAFRSWTLHI